MVFKVVLLAAVLAVAQAGIPAAYSSSSISHGHPGFHGIHGGQVVQSIGIPQAVHAAPIVQSVHGISSYGGLHGGVHAVHAAPIAKAIIAEAPAQYNFGYSVHDPHTGDIKDQQESRNGDVVQGSYSLVEADGTRRVVHYSADAHNGFNAVVEHQGAKVVKAVQPVVQKVAAPLAYAGHGIASPLAYAGHGLHGVAASPLGYAAHGGYSSVSQVAHGSPVYGGHVSPYGIHG